MLNHNTVSQRKAMNDYEMFKCLCSKILTLVNGPPLRACWRAYLRICVYPSECVKYVWHVIMLQAPLI